MSGAAGGPQALLVERGRAHPLEGAPAEDADMGADMEEEEDEEEVGSRPGVAPAARRAACGPGLVRSSAHLWLRSRGWAPHASAAGQRRAGACASSRTRPGAWRWAGARGCCGARECASLQCTVVSRLTDLLARGAEDSYAHDFAKERSWLMAPAGAQAPAPCTSCDAARSDWEIRHSDAFAGRCTRCQRLYEKGNYCPVCDQARCDAVRGRGCCSAGSSEVHWSASSAQWSACHSTASTGKLRLCPSSCSSKPCGHACLLGPRAKQQRATGRLGGAQVWQMSDRNMVGCDSCDFWVHDHCDPRAALALAAGSEDVPYQCPRCAGAAGEAWGAGDAPRGEWGPGAQAQLAKLREVRQALREAEPRRPRTSFQLFVMDVHRCARAARRPGGESCWACAECMVLLGGGSLAVTRWVCSAGCLR